MRNKSFRIMFFCFLTLVLFVTSAIAHKDSEVTIKRDNYGVPHVYAKSTEGLFYGYGYAVAQDRLYQIEMFRRTFWGRLSEVYGNDVLAFDQSNRRDNLTRAEITRQIANLKPEVKTAMKFFAKGINAYISEALADRTNKLPKEFQQFGFDPEPWTSEDVAADFLSVMGFFMDLTGELANASMLSYLVNSYEPVMAQELFDDWCWGLDPDSPTTIVDKRKPGFRNGTPPKKGHWKHPLMASVLKSAQGAETVLVRERLEQKRMFAKAFPYGHPSSYAVVIGPKKSETGKPMLMGGPQFDYELPSALYEVGLHGAGIDAVGSTLTGYPFIMFGHNRRAAFSSTAGADNIEDVFAEQLNPANNRQYLFKDKWKDMEVRPETFVVSGGSPVTVDFLYTVHGPVFYVDEANHVAFSKKLSCREGFLRGISSFFNLMKAETVTEFNKAAMLSDMSINYFFANVDGDIAYYHLGLHPVRAKGVDVRLPTPGTGEFEWRGFIPKNKNPHQSNPKQGYFVNWNNQPEPGWGHGDLATTDLWGGWGADARVTNLINLVEAQPTLGSEDLKAIIKNIAFYDKRALNIKELLIDAVEYVPKSADADAALAYLGAWNNLNIDETPKDGFYDDPGSALFNAWWGKAVAATFGSWYEGYQNANGYSAVNILSNLYLGYTLFNRALNGTSRIDYFNGQKGQIIYKALEDALAELSGNYAMPTMMWQFFPVTILGFYFGQPVVSSVGSLPPFPYVDRGTENHIVALGCKGISAENITPPGNSAFIRADGEISPHFDDQVNMFLNFTYKPMLFTGSDVNGALESTQVLKFK